MKTYHEIFLLFEETSASVFLTGGLKFKIVSTKLSNESAAQSSACSSLCRFLIRFFNVPSFCIILLFWARNTFKESFCCDIVEFARLKHLSIWYGDLKSDNLISRKNRGFWKCPLRFTGLFFKDIVSSALLFKLEGDLRSSFASDTISKSACCSDNEKFSVWLR